jgi:hypothetical protein
MKNYLFLLVIFAATFSCTEKPVVEEQTKFCWNIVDYNFVFIKAICDKTAAEIAVDYPDGFYYRSDEPLKCWYEASSNSFAKNMPLSLLKKFSPTINYVEANCNYCAQWYYREKRKYLPNNSITYTNRIGKTLCGDTLTTLFRGREVFLRQSTDSFIVRQFSDNGYDW